MPQYDDSNVDRGRWFGELPEHIREDMERSCIRLKVKRGSAIFRQGDPVRGIYGIVSGEAQVIGTTRAGLDVLVAMHRPGDWTGFLASMDGGPYTVTVLATQACEVKHLPQAAVERIFMQDVAAYRLLAMPEYTARRQVYAHMVEQLSFTPLQRLANRLVALSAPIPEGAVTRTISPITQDQLAMSVMTSRQWTNRLLQILEQANMISRGRGRIDILDIPRLVQLATHGESEFVVPALGPGAPATAK